MSDSSPSDGSPPRLESWLTVAARPRDRWPEAGALVGLVVAFGLAGGPLGLLVGLGTAVVWAGLGTPYAIAVGALLLGGLGPASTDAGALALVTVGFLALVVAPAVRTDRAVGVATVSGATLLGAGGVAWLALRWHSLWVAAALTVGCLGLASYGLYRYSLVSLGLVDDPAATAPRDGDAT